MTRACTSVPRPASPKQKRSPASSSSKNIPMQEGGILKRQPSSPLKTLKSFTKVLSKAEYLAQLRNMLPKTSGQNEEMSELALVEQTIAYIGYLESILSSDTDQDTSVESTMSLMKRMSF